MTNEPQMHSRVSLVAHTVDGLSGCRRRRSNKVTLSDINECTFESLTHQADREGIRDQDVPHWVHSTMVITLGAHLSGRTMVILLGPSLWRGRTHTVCH